MKMRITFTTDEEHLGYIIAKTMGKIQGLDITNAVAVKAPENGKSHRLDAAAVLLPIVRAKPALSVDLVAAYKAAGATEGAAYGALAALRKKKFIVKGRDGKYHVGKGAPR